MTAHDTPNRLAKAHSSSAAWRRPLAGVAKRWAALALGVAVAATALVSATLAQAETRRVALVIGNAKYQSLPILRNPVNELNEVSAVLRRAGFDVISAVDQDRLGLEESIKRFFRSLPESDVGMFYYSGHAIQLSGKNYIVPTDASLASAYDVEIQTVDLETVLDQMRRTTKTQLVFLDACRNNPFRTERYWIAEKLQPVSQTQGLAGIQPGVGSLIAYSTEPYNVSYDGGGTLSPFSQSFISRALTPNQEIRTLLTHVRRDVIDATAGRQRPWESSSMTDAFYFVTRSSGPIVAPMQHVQVAAGSTAAVAIAEPQTYRDSDLRVTFDLLPEKGELVADGKPVKRGETHPASVFRSLRYNSEDAPAGFVGIVGYTVSNQFEQSSRGLVALTIAGEGAKPVSASDKGAVELSRSAAADVTSSIERVSRRLAARRSRIPIGVGPVSLGLEPLFPATAVAPPLLTVTVLPPKGTVQLNGNAILEGARISAAEIGKLAYEPQIGTQAQSFVVEMRLADQTASTQNRLTVTIEPTLHECDVLAGEPLDLGGVAAGVLPNEIDATRARVACGNGLRDYPKAARFQYQLGRAQLAARELDAAWKNFEQSAERGHARSYYQLGYLYTVNAGRPTDRAKANDYYKKNADLGDPYGIYNYGRALFYGRGLPADVPAGLAMLLRAAEMGHTYAMNELGAIFLYGRSLTQDEARGIEFYRAGAVRKDIYSLNNLGLAYLNGVGVNRDLKRAYDLFTSASREGHPGAPANIGQMYRDGLFVKKDIATAAKWFETAAERGDSWGAFARATLGDQGRPAADAKVVARFLALTIALDRNNTITGARERLAQLPAPVKIDAARTLARGLGREPGGGETGEQLDQRLVELARDSWQRRNPRVDLF